MPECLMYRSQIIYYSNGLLQFFQFLATIKGKGRFQEEKNIKNNLVLILNANSLTFNFFY